jgi:hypothetical protein
MGMYVDYFSVMLIFHFHDRVKMSKSDLIIHHPSSITIILIIQIIGVNDVM